MALYIDGKLIAGIGNDGITPHIGENGNWFLGDEDTGVHAEGPQGEKGDTGDTGATGPQGETGEGVPSGGNAGQVLTKKTNSDYDTEWKDPPTPESGGVTSFNGRDGAVIPVDNDYSADMISFSSDSVTGDTVQEAIENIASSVPTDTGVTSFNGRDGAVTPAAGDYTAEQVGALPIEGGTLTGGISLSNNRITNLGWPMAQTDAATVSWVEGTINSMKEEIDQTIAEQINDAWAAAY